MLPQGIRIIVFQVSESWRWRLIRGDGLNPADQLAECIFGAESEAGAVWAAQVAGLTANIAPIEIIRDYMSRGE